MHPNWRQEEKGTTEDEMVGWHHRLDGHEFEQAPGVGDGQGSLACCSPAAKSLQSCPTLCDPIDGSPPGFLVPGILQAKTLEWVAISFSSAWKWKVKVKSLSHVQLLVTPWTAAYQAPLSMGFSRQEYWSGVPLPSLCCSPWGHKESDMTEQLNWMYPNIHSSIICPSTDEWIKKMWCIGLAFSFTCIYTHTYTHNGIILLSHKNRMEFCHFQQHGWTLRVLC